MNILPLRHFRLAARLSIIALPALLATPALAEKAYIPNASDNTISVVDVPTASRIGTITTGGGAPADPSSLVISPDGATAYVTLSGTNSVAVMTLATGTVSASILVGQAPGGIAITPDGSRVFVANYGDNTVSVIETASRMVSQSITVGNAPDAVAVTPDGRHAFVANWTDDSVSEIDVASASVLSTVPVGTWPDAVAVTPDGSKAYVANWDSHSVSVIDVATASVSATIEVDGGPDSLALSPDGTLLYVLSEDGNLVFVVDTATGAAKTTIPVGYTPHGLAFTPDGSHAYVVNDVADTVSVIDVAAAAVSSTVNVGNYPWAVALTPDGSKAYVLNDGGGTISVIDTASGLVGAVVPLGPSWLDPYGVAFSPDGTLAYFTNSADRTVSVVATGTDTVTATVTVGLYPEGIAVTPDGSKAYVANSADGTVSVIRTADNSVTATIPVGPSPWGVAVAPNGRKAYVTGLDESTISVIDVATDAVSNAIAFDGDWVGAVGFAPDGRIAYAAANPAQSLAGVAVIDVASDTVVSTIPASFGTNELAFTADGSTAYISTSTGLEVVDVRTQAIGATISIAAGVGGVAVSADGSKVFVPSGGTATLLSIVDTATNGVSTIPLGNQPHALGNFIQPVRSPLAAAVLPGARSVPAGGPATVFATMLNGGAAMLGNCAIGLDASAPTALTMSYQTTNPASNAPTGTPNTPVTLAAGSAQSFVLSFQSGSALADPGQPMTYTCAGAAPAPITSGVNTVDLLFSSSPTQDVIALAATAPQPGVVTVPFSEGGGAAFAIATYNAGIAGTLTVSADTGTASLPVSLVLCPTDPQTARCLQAPAASFQQSFAAGAASTFSIFVGASGAIPFSPGTSRVFVRFTDAIGVTHGSTSVAVDTE